MSKPSSTYRDRLERAALALETSEVVRLSRAWILKEKNSSEALLVSARCLRLVNEGQRAFAYLELLEKKKNFDLDTEPKKAEVLCERILSLASLGALSYPRALVQTIETYVKEPHELARYHHATLQLESSLPHFRSAIAQFDQRPTPGEQSRESRILMAYGSTFRWLSRPQEAIPVYSEAISRLKSSNSIDSQKLINRAEYELAVCELILGNLKSAKKWFLKAQRNKPTGFDIATGEAALLAGAYFLRTGDLDRAQAQLDQAQRFLYFPGKRPEPWLQVLYWRGELEFRRKPGAFPKSWQRLLVYPTPANWWVKSMGELTEIPSEIRFFNELKKSSKSARVLYPQFNLSAVKTQGPTPDLEFGLSNDERLLSILAGAGPLGIPEFRIYDSLWSNEPFSFLTFRNRLKQVSARIRKQRHSLTWKDGHLIAAASNAIGAAFEPSSPSIEGLPFLRLHSQFKRSEIEASFGMSPTAAKRLLAYWKRLGVVRAVGGRYEFKT